jgi:hypothetical protein
MLNFPLINDHDMSEWISTAWNWARANDIPNWVVVAFTAVLWPAALFFWQQRKVQGVPGLEVHFVDCKIRIGEQQHAAIDIVFTNHTGSVVYISGARVRSCTKNFPVPVEASRDVAQNSYHLKFTDSEGNYVMREVTLQTSQSGKTCMPASQPMQREFFSHTASYVSRVLRRPKYFVLEYTAMVGTARYSISTWY